MTKISIVTVMVVLCLQRLLAAAVTAAAAAAAGAASRSLLMFPGSSTRRPLLLSPHLVQLGPRCQWQRDFHPAVYAHHPRSLAYTGLNLKTAPRQQLGHASATRTRRPSLHMKAAADHGSGSSLFVSATTELTTRLGLATWAWIPGSLIAILMGGSIAHALQGGVRGYLGRSQEEILGNPVENATAEDVAALGKAGFMQLFYASPCPQEGDLDGEYQAHTLDMGVLHPIASLITHRIWGPGRWLGKAIKPGTAEGYNLFSTSRDKPIGEKLSFSQGMLRERRFDFSISAPSVFDSGSSAKLNYGVGKGNGLLFGGMRDEVRKVNSQLFVGLGYIQAFGGKYNTAPFVLEGPPVGQFSDER